ncbi:MAG: DNA-directed RNA polymerase specialized sigma24 family protein, partial [Myxococcota bacterium]
EAFAVWLADAEPAIRRSLSSFAATVDTEAVLQETLLRVWQVAPRVKSDGRPNSLLRLGTRIARNLAIDQTRRNRVWPVEPADLEVSVEPSMPDPMLRRAIQACREQLAGPASRALSARLDGRAPDRELAEVLGMKLNTFLKNVGRARKSLAECLRRRGVTLEGA